MGKIKIDLTSGKFYGHLLKITLAAAAAALASAPMVWISSVKGYSNVVVSGSHILFGNSGLEPFMKNIQTGQNTYVSLNPQAIMIAALAFLIGALVLSFLPKKTFYPIPLIVVSALLAWLSCDHFGWIDNTDYGLRWGFWLYAFLLLLSILLTFVSAGLSRLKVRSGEFKDHVALLTMLIPGCIFLLIFAYLPMPGVLLAFKNYKLQGSSLFENFFKSAWVGFNNFRFIFSTPDAFNMTRNTVVYNKKRRRYDKCRKECRWQFDEFFQVLAEILYQQKRTSKRWGN